MPRISFRRDIAANWTDLNPILHSGEFGYELDTGNAKVGNGEDAWVDLAYFAKGDAGLSAYEIAVFYGFSGTEEQWLESLQGDDGDAGPPGATGAIGPPGPTGDPGATGSMGPAGVDGSTWFNAAGAPSGGTGVNGDYYLNDTNGDTYQKVSGTWTLIGNIMGPGGGPAGPTGPAGPQGEPGVAGPAGADGADGADGATGPTGPAGPPGADGADGADGINGADGADGSAIVYVQASMPGDTTIGALWFDTDEPV